MTRCKYINNNIFFLLKFAYFVCLNRTIHSLIVLCSRSFKVMRTFILNFDSFFQLLFHMPKVRRGSLLISLLRTPCILQRCKQAKTVRKSNTPNTKFHSHPIFSPNCNLAIALTAYLQRGLHAFAKVKLKGRKILIQFTVVFEIGLLRVPFPT